MLRPTPDPTQLAATAARLCKTNECATPAFDACFVGGYEDEVVAAFVALYRQDVSLARAVVRNAEYIDIARWMDTALRLAAHKPVAVQGGRYGH